MENREVIEWLKGCVVSYEVDDKGRPNGNVTCDLTQEVIDMAISALEKQEPMKPMAPELDPLGGVTHPCGNCGGELVSKFHDFCPWCGQAIKWEK